MSADKHKILSRGGNNIKSNNIENNNIENNNIESNNIESNNIKGNNIENNNIEGNNIESNNIEGNKIIVPFHIPGLKERLFFFSSGAIVSIPLTLLVGAFSSSLCTSFPGLYAELCSTAIFAPFVEEFAKAYPLFYRHGETIKSIFVLGFLVGLGFGISEFFLYVFGLGAPVYIRLPGIFFHASSTSITAYGIAIKRPLPFYIAAAILHLSYNFSTFLGMAWLIIGPSSLIITYSLSWHLFHRTSEKMVY